MHIMKIVVVVAEHGKSAWGEFPSMVIPHRDCLERVENARASPRVWRVRDDCESAIMLIALFLLASLSSWPGGAVAWRLQRWLSAWRSSWTIRGLVCESSSALGRASRTV